MKVLEIEPMMLQHISIDIQTEEMIKLAISKNPNVITLIKEPNFELCKLAIDQNVESLSNIVDPGYDICEYAISISPIAAKYILKLHIDLQKNLVYNNINNIFNINNPDKELCMHVLINHENTLKILKYIIKFANFDISDDFYKIAINKNYKYLSYIDKCSEELIFYAIDINPKAIFFINDYEPNIELCKYVMNKNNYKINKYINYYLNNSNEHKWSWYVDKYFYYNSYFYDCCNNDCESDPDDYNPEYDSKYCDIDFL